MATPSRITVGSAPDSWGVWFPSDPEQTTADRFLREVSGAGYDWIELGPYGYLPTDPSELADALSTHGLRVSAGTVFEHLHRPDSWEDVWKQVTDVAALTKAVGGGHIIVIPEPWRDHRTGAAIESPELPAEQWRALTTGMPIGSVLGFSGLSLLLVLTPGADWAYMGRYAPRLVGRNRASWRLNPDVPPIMAALPCR